MTTFVLPDDTVPPLADAALCGNGSRTSLFT
jgi:hypothetical protein